MVTGMAPEIRTKGAEVLETLVRQIVVAQRLNQVACRGPPDADAARRPGDVTYRHAAVLGEVTA